MYADYRSINDQKGKETQMKTLRYILVLALAVVIGILIARASIIEADAEIEQIDAFIEEYSAPETTGSEPETVSLSYEEWQATSEVENLTTEMDVWTLGSYLYGISELDTTRALKIITYESYGYSPLSYYVACCCWVRATENYWGYPNLYEAFGEADAVSNGGQYGEWMDCLEVADWAIYALEQCYLNPAYVQYCNGMTIPEGWIYAEEGIYVW